MGEFALIARLERYLTGAGDDTAVLDLGDRQVCLTVDAVVEGVHFRRDVSDWEDVGWKAIAINISDVAATPGRPVAAVVALCRPPSVSDDDIEAMYHGMRAAADRWDLVLAGGDTNAAEQLSVAVTVLGAVDAPGPTGRGGARPGDQLVIVGPLGAGATALAQVLAGAEPDAGLLAAHRRPPAYVAAGRVLAEHGATALIDVSDGLGADLGHIAVASGVEAHLDARALPVARGVGPAARKLGLDPLDLVCSGGEDFALVAALPPAAAEAAVAAAGAAEGVVGAVVGEVRSATGAPRVTVRTEEGSTIDIGGSGYEHFRRQS